MKLSRKGAIFIGRFEGWMPNLYNDLAGDAHIGFGHKLHDGPYTAEDEREWNPPITKAQGLEILQADAQRAAGAVDHQVRVSLRRGQTDALISFTFNLGPNSNGLKEVARLLNAGEPQEARKAMLKYDHVGTVRYPGLTRRRRAEARLFRTGFYFLNRL